MLIHIAPVIVAGMNEWIGRGVAVALLAVAWTVSPWAFAALAVTTVTVHVWHKHQHGHFIGDKPDPRPADASENLRATIRATVGLVAVLALGPAVGYALAASINAGFGWLLIALAVLAVIYGTYHIKRHGCPSWVNTDDPDWHENVKGLRQALTSLILFFGLFAVIALFVNM